jgi:hypothetical protein
VQQRETERSLWRCEGNEDGSGSDFDVILSQALTHIFGRARNGVNALRTSPDRFRPDASQFDSPNNSAFPLLPAVCSCYRQSRTTTSKSLIKFACTRGYKKITTPELGLLPVTIACDYLLYPSFLIFLSSHSLDHISRLHVTFVNNSLWYQEYTKFLLRRLGFVFLWQNNCTNVFHTCFHSDRAANSSNTPVNFTKVHSIPCTILIGTLGESNSSLSISLLFSLPISLTLSYFCYCVVV